MGLNTRHTDAVIYRIRPREVAIKSSRPYPHSAKVIPLFSGASSATTDPEDDRQLLARVGKGDHVAFSELVRRHAPRFYRVAYRFLSNRTAAEDIVQEGFLKLWERPHLWNAEKNAAFTTWFYRIIVNQCLDHAKKKHPLPLLDDSWIADNRDSQEEEMIEEEKRSLVERQIALLPERQRTALMLCFYEGLSNQEAADVMGVGLKALQALLMRAKTTLKRELTPPGGN